MQTATVEEIVCIFNLRFARPSYMQEGQFFSQLFITTVGVDRRVYPKHATTNNFVRGHISLRPAGTSPILGEDYLLVFLGGPTPPLRKMQYQNA